MPRIPLRKVTGEYQKILPYDLFETPDYALDPLIPYLNPNWVIWEPACGSGRIVNKLKTANFAVFGTDLQYGHNFFKVNGKCDAIVTNPPYSIVRDWVQRCHSINKPFALLVPVYVIGMGEVQHMMNYYGAELLLLDKRINYSTPNKGWNGSGAHFSSLWYCHGILPQSIVYGRIDRNGS